MKELTHAIYADVTELVSLQGRASGFSFLPRRAMGSVLTGRHTSRLRGRGLNFEELRHYRYGDDIRSMDWKVTRRTRHPHVRVFTEEKERSVMLLIDQRKSMFFGSQVKMKSVVAAEIAAASAWRVLSLGDRVGALVFNDREIKHVRPHRSRNTVMQIINQTIEFNHQLKAGKGLVSVESQFNQALKEAGRLCGHDCLIIIVSDMNGMDQQSVKRLKRLSRHNDVIASLVYDPLERKLPKTGKMLVSDGELQIQIDSSKTTLAEAFSRKFNDRIEYLQNELTGYGVPVILVDTIHPILDQIQKALGGRRNA
jgi:uncharacterized protein (DUF58 family)